MVDVERSIAHVRAKGNPVERARLDSVLSGKAVPESIVQKLRDMLNPDGGFTYWLPGRSQSTVCDTAYFLGWLDDLSLRSGDIVELAVKFLFKHQKNDGGWDEVEQLRNLKPPEFLSPGETRTRVWLTAYCAHWLMLFGHADSHLCSGCPVDFLVAHREPSGRLFGYLRATWDALPIFQRFPRPDTEPFNQALKVTEAEFKPHRWAGSYLAWLLRGLRDAELPPHDPFVKCCLEAVVRKQRPDGRWDSESGEEHSVDATIEVLRVLRDYEVI